MRLTASLALVVLGALAVPAAAGAATKDVLAGKPAPRPGDGWKKNFDDNAFYPSKIQVTQGSTLRFTIAGFHNVAYVPRGQKPPAFAALDPANPVGQVTDPAGAPYWFSGRPRITVEPKVFVPQGPKEVDGSTFVGSGLPAEGAAPKPFSVRMTGKPGRYRFLCSIHPGMTLDATVKPRSARVPSPAQDRRAARRQYAAAVRRVTALARAKAPAGRVVQAGNDEGTIAYFGFRPARTTIKAGQSVTFRMSRRSSEIHNVAFGPAAYLEALSRRFVAPAADASGAFALTLSPEVMYPSDPPGSWPALDGTTHGNGFFNTGTLDTDAATPLARNATVRFARPGTYGFICNVHPDMKGTVTVTS